MVGGVFGRVAVERFPDGASASISAERESPIARRDGYGGIVVPIGGGDCHGDRSEGNGECEGNGEWFEIHSIENCMER